MRLKLTIARERETRELLKSKATLVASKDKNGLLFNIYDSRDYATLKERDIHIFEKEARFQRMKAIDDEMDLDSILMIQELKDIESYCSVSNLGRIIIANIMTRVTLNYARENGIKPEKVNLDDIDKKTIIPYVRDELCDKAEYIDWDKFLEISAYRAKQLLETEKKLTKEEFQILNEILDKLQRSIEHNGIPQVKEEKAQGNTSKAQTEEKIDNSFSIGEKEKLLSGEKSLSDVDYTIAANLSEQEKIACCMKSIENTLFLLEHNLIEDNQGKAFLSICPISDGAITNLLLLKHKGILTAQDIINLYLNGNLKLKQILQIKDDIKNELTEEQLIRQYRMFRASATAKERGRKYITLYREILLKNITPEEKKERIRLILDKLGDKPKTDELIGLYKQGVLPLETLIEIKGEQIITTMLENAALSYEDIQELLMTAKIYDIQINNAIKSRMLTNAEKFFLIFSAFGKENQENLRRKLYACLKIEKNTIASENAIQKDRNEPIPLDPAYRIQLLLGMDCDSTFELTRNGYAIVKLLNEDKVIIEKMFQKTYRKVEGVSGEPTYILNRIDYERGTLLKDPERINRAELRLLAKQGKCDIYYHSRSWAESIADTFDARDKSSNTEERIQQINSIINKINTSRESI